MSVRKNSTVQFALLALLCIPLLYAGWRLFWFLTDDAFISFRYVSNSILGYGYVWNPPPFLPVEGYSNFLWVVLLDGVWRAFGIQPPVSSNYLSLLFSFGTLLVTIAMVMKMRWSATLAPRRLLFGGLVVLATLTNRTFLAWTSSGLETAMFNFFFTLWIFTCLFVETQTLRWLFLLALSSSLAALTRADGLLFWGSTMIILGVDVVSTRGWRSAARMASMLPAALVPLHFVWRRAFYHEWLPNTFYAKTTSPWPESGGHYFLSFVVEYALWMWLTLAIVLLSRAALHSTKRSGPKRRGLIRSMRAAGRRVASDSRFFASLIAISTVVIHFAYYTLVIGGDHFEYRVYSHTIPLIFLSFVWLLNRTRLRVAAATALFSLFILLSYPLPWTHWMSTRNLTTREQTFRLKEPVAPHFPSYLAWYARPFDDLQSWLIDRSVCMRHQEHKVFCRWQFSQFPARGVGLTYQSDTYPVCALFLVGVPSWVLPKVNIIDMLGLNDYVIARNPVNLDHNVDDADPRGLPQMAHDRRPPPGYVEGFEVNVGYTEPDGKVIIVPRNPPMTADKIIEHEKKWRRIAASWKTSR